MANNIMSEKKDIFKRAFCPLELILIFAVCVIFVQVLAEVVSRYIFNFSIAWGEELAETLIVWTTFLGAVIAMLYSDHMSINILAKKIHNALLAKLVLLLADLIVIYFLVFAIYGGVQVVRNTWAMQTVTMEIPAGVLYLAFPVASVLMLIVAIRNFFMHLKGEME